MSFVYTLLSPPSDDHKTPPPTQGRWVDVVVTTRTPPRTTRHAGQRGSATQSKVDDPPEFAPPTLSTWFTEKERRSTVSPHGNDIDDRSTPVAKKSYKKEAEATHVEHRKYGKKAAEREEEADDESTFSARKKTVEDGDKDGAAEEDAARVEGHDHGAVEHRVVIAGGDDSSETNYEDDDKRNVSRQTFDTIYIDRMARGCKNAVALLFDYFLLIIYNEYNDL